MNVSLLRRTTIEFLCLLTLLGGAPIQAMTEAGHYRQQVRAREEARQPKSEQAASENTESKKSALESTRDWIEELAEGEANPEASAESGPSSPTEHSPAKAEVEATSKTLLASASQPTLVSAPKLLAAPPVDLVGNALSAPKPPRPPSKSKAHADSTPTPLDPALKSADQIPVAAAWNLISLPKEPTDTSIGTVLQAIGGQYDEVWTYDACNAADPWKLYDTNDLPGSDLGTLDHKPGIWLHGTSQTTLPVDGTVPATTTYQLCTGWNLIGYPSIEPRHPEAVLSPIEGKWVRLFGYDPFTPDDLWQGYDHQAPEWANNLPAMLPGRGYWLLVTEDTTLEIANQGAPPGVDLVTPEDLAVVTQPTEVIGTVESPLLQSWNLSFRAVGDADWQEIGAGNAPISSEALGTFDPTLLLNGLYEIRLQAIDIAGQQVEEAIAVSVEGNMKIGHFTLSFIDLAIPLSGLDIEIVRTYDSRQRLTQGDFGYGWSLDIRQGSYRNNRPTGDGWQIIDPGGPGITLPCSQIIETKSHLTVVRLSDQEVYRFRQVLKDAATVVGGCFARAEFEWVDGPLPGTTLEILGNDEVIYEGQGSRVIDRNTLELFEPEDVKLITRDGRIFHLDLSEGVTHLEDLNGNTLEITTDGITHSSGRGIEFIRDSEGRVTELIAPNGTTNTYTYAASGDLQSFQDRGGARTSFRYRNHYLQELDNALGVRAIRADYDNAGRMVRMIDADGFAIGLEHDLSDRREIITNRLGYVQIMEYDRRGNVTKEINELGHETERTYDSNDNLLAVTDPLGHTTQYSYDDKNDLLTVRDPLGHSTLISYHSLGFPVAVTNALNQTTNHAYNSRGLLQWTEDPLGQRTVFEYDAKGQVLSVTNPLGHKTLFAYDSFGNLERETDALGHIRSYSYDNHGNRLSESTTRTLPTGVLEIQETFVEYDALDRAIIMTAADASTTSKIYDALGQVTARINTLGLETSMEYDTQGRLVRTSFPDGSRIGNTYDDEGQLALSRDALDRVTRYAYDAAGRHIATTFPGASEPTTRSTFDAADRLVAKTDARGFTTTYSYDASSRLERVTDPRGYETRFGLDPVGRIEVLRDARGHTVRYVYDHGGRQSLVISHDGSKVETIYDALNRRQTVVDQEGKRTDFRYDALGRLISVTDALGHSTTYGYDEVSNSIRQTDANGNSTLFEYDSRGRETARQLPDGTRELFRYRLDGMLESHRRFDGAMTHYTYDLAGRLAERRFHDGTSHAFTYTPAGRRASGRDTQGNLTSFEYDERDRLVGKTDANGHRLLYTYDESGNRIALIAQVGGDSQATRYAFDESNRIKTVTDPQGGTYTFDYDEVGQRLMLTYPNGVSTSWTYDSQNRLTDLITRNPVGAVLQRFHYEMALTGHRTLIEEADGTRSSYTYDDLWRLTEDRATDHAGDLIYRMRFQYDSVGNRLNQETLFADSSINFSAYTFDGRDRLLVQDNATWNWDLRGRLLMRPGSGEMGITNFIWDEDNRLRQAQRNGASFEASYDTEGDLIGFSESTGTEVENSTLLVDASDSLSYVVADVDNSRTPRVYIRAGDQLLASTQGSESRYFHQDAIGSVRSWTGSTGTLEGEQSYSAFGELVSRSLEVQPYGFAGERWNDTFSLAYHRARWLDPRQQRFLSRDPLRGVKGRPLSKNTFIYSEKDPVNRKDPSGLFATSVTQVSVSTAASASVNLAFSFYAYNQLVLLQTRLWMAGALNSLTSPGLMSAIALDPFASAELRKRRLLAKSKVEEPKSKCDGNILYHYTAQWKAMSILLSQSMFITRSYPDPYGGADFPRGVYSTDVAPWEPGWTLRRLAELFYFNPIKQRTADLTHFVAICNDIPPYFQPLRQRQWYKITDQVHAVAIGKNPMP